MDDPLSRNTADCILSSYFREKWNYQGGKISGCIQDSVKYLRRSYFAKVVNCFQRLIIITKSSASDVSY